MNNPFDTIEKRLEKIEAGIMKLAKRPEQEISLAEKYLTVDQVSEMLSVTRVTLWSWERKGILESCRIGNQKRYRLSEIEKILSK